MTMDNLKYIVNSTASSLPSCESEDFSIPTPPLPTTSKSKDIREATKYDVWAMHSDENLVNKFTGQGDSVINEQFKVAQERRPFRSHRQRFHQEQTSNLDFGHLALAEISQEQFSEVHDELDYENCDRRAMSWTINREKARSRKSVSFGLVRTHKICQGIDPPSSQVPTESTDCDLTETELCSLEVYELVYRSPTRKSPRRRRPSRIDTGFQNQSLPFFTENSEESNTHPHEETSIEETTLLESQVTSYHVIQAVDDACPRELLVAKDFEFPRSKRKN